MKSYEQKYKAALEWMRSLYDGLHGATKEDAEKYFPELKENKSERVRKELIKTISSLLDNTILYHTDITKEEALAWLEKQGEKSTIIDIDKMVMEYSQTKDGDFGLPVNCMIRAYRKGINDALSMALNIEKQGEKKSVDKPKFKVGDWITDGHLTCKVLSVTGKSYELHLHNDDYCHFETDIQSVNKYYHLWTIHDAMDGDVLVGKDDRPFIFTGEFDVQDDNPTAYCGINSDDKFITGKGSHWTFKDGIKPATKEQRDWLFSKMKEAGYEWDSEKKELKKIEPKFKVRDWIVDYVGNYWRVVKVRPNYYELDGDDGVKTRPTRKYVDEKYHLWTIEDAKDGDVLDYVTDEEDLWIMIYRSLYEPYEGHVHYHALLVNDNFSDKGTCCICIDNLKPATKEQRDLLFQKMKEAGYEWDADKKELKKIEVASKENGDERMLREIKRYIKEQGDKPTGLPNGTVPVSDMITWLEKQGDNIPTLTDKDYDKLFINCKHEKA